MSIHDSRVFVVVNEQYERTMTNWAISKGCDWGSPRNSNTLFLFAVQRAAFGDPPVKIAELS